MASRAFSDEEGQYQANRTCSRLVFSPAQSSTLYLHDAVSFHLMAALSSEIGCICQGLALGVSYMQPSLVRGVYGLLLVWDIFKRNEGPPVSRRTQSFERLHFQAGGSYYKVVHWAPG